MALYFANVVVKVYSICSSYVYQNVTPHEACNDNHYHLFSDSDNQVRLKLSSPWYTQIQCQLGVCNLSWCDFVFFTKRRIVIDRITFDPDFYVKIIEKSTKFFKKYVLQA